MSSIKLTADSGGGTFEIKAPTSSSNTRVLTLPDTGNITVPDTNGITVAQQFRLLADQSGSASAGTVLTNWEESDTDYQRVGSSTWSQSSGIFSCSATGIYLCQWTFVVSNSTGGDAYDPNIQISTDSGGNYNTRSRSWAHIAAGEPRDSPQNQFIFDVANTSTFRLRYRQSQDNACSNVTTIAGSSSETMTNILFIRLGDT